ncbi:MAG: phosphoglycerate kinase [bacterium]
MNIKTIKNLKDFGGKKFLLRLDLNVPMIDGIIQDDYRIKRSLATINYLKNGGAKIIIISHTESDPNNSLRSVANFLNYKFLDLDFNTLEDKIRKIENGEIVVLENLRTNPGEKKNDEAFTKELSSLADFFVNEAFSVSHREHASIVGIPKYLPSYFGFLFEEEIDNLSLAFNPEHPFTFILGGAKFETKLPLVEKFLNIADQIFIGGALANSFYKELGYQTGKSLVDNSDLNLKKLSKNSKIFLPEDVVVNTPNGDKIKNANDVFKEETIVDNGPLFIAKLEKAISSSKFILWNGPLGLAEKGYSEATNRTSGAIANSKAKSIIGGGDTIAAINKLDIMNKFSFVSTGGGAMLDFLSNGTLPGIEAIK